MGLAEWGDGVPWREPRASGSTTKRLSGMDFWLPKLFVGTLSLSGVVALGFLSPNLRSTLSRLFMDSCREALLPEASSSESETQPESMEMDCW